MKTNMKTSSVKISDLKLDPKNARSHSKRNIEAIKRSLERFGQQKPVVVSSDGLVVAGNGTVEAAHDLGWTHVAVVRTKLSAKEARAYAVADNRTTDLSEWNEEALVDTIQELEEDRDLIDAIGFDDNEIARLLDSGELKQDEVPEAPETPVTKPGDLWILGDHRLLCGDAAIPEDLDRLLDGARVHLVNTDPPYNVRVEPRSNNAIAAGKRSFRQTHHQKLDLTRHPEKSRPTTRRLRAKDRPLENDFVSDEEFAGLLRRWFGNIARVLVPGRAAYIWGGYDNCANYPSALKDSGLYFSQAIIWVKEHPVLTRKDFMGNHEWCFYTWREGAAHEFFGPANATDVWSVKKVNPQSMVHLTEKPVELATRAIDYSSRPGENVLDLFGGSGSTLIACEQAKRNAYLMEIDPLYTDVIVERWQRFTGEKARLEGGGSYGEVRTERTGGE